MDVVSSRFKLVFTLVFTLVASVILLNQHQPSSTDKQQVPDAAIGNVQSLSTAYVAWKSRMLNNKINNKLVLPLTYSKSLPTQPTQAYGTASLDLVRGTLAVEVFQLPESERYDLWLIDNNDSSANVEIRLGALSYQDGTATFNAQLHSEQLIGVKLDQLVIVSAGHTPTQGGLLSGSPSLFQRMYHDELRGTSPIANTGNSSPKAGTTLVSRLLTPFSFLIPAPAYAAAGGTDLAALVAQGEQLFFNETFGGNGRTCGTCHRGENNFTIDPTFIATLPANDPLFVAEFDPALTDLEDSALMRNFGLIRTNVDGFEDPVNKFIMRSVPHMLGMSLSIQSNAVEAPFDMTGWAGDGAPGGGRLRDFATGAVIQHFPKSLARATGVDFRLPTEAELDALEAFTLSLGRQQETDLHSLQLLDDTAERGRVIFLAEDSENLTVQAGKCNICHRNAGALTVAGLNQNFNTGVENMPHPAALMGLSLPNDGGFGTDLNANGSFGNNAFNSTSLWEAADTAPFFHHNAATTLEEAIAFYESDVFRNSEEGQRLKLQDSGGDELFVEVDALAAFLRVINAVENIRSTTEYVTHAKSVSTAGESRQLTLAMADLDDALGVLNQGELHVDDAVPHLADARTALQSAMTAATLVERDGLIDQVLSHMSMSHDSMVTSVTPGDTVAPTIAITAPVEGDSVSGALTITADAFDDTGVAQVSFSVNGAALGQDNVAPFAQTWDSTTGPDGITNIIATATDASGNSASASISVTANNAVSLPTDSTPPVVAIIAPVAGNTVSGSVIISADATDDVAIDRVIFKVGQTELGQVLFPPFDQLWNSAAFSDGSNTLTIIAVDTSGNTTLASHSVVVDNAVPCTVYSCPNPEPPSSTPPPDQSMPVGSSPDGEFDGTLSAKDTASATVTISMADGSTVTLTLTDQTIFNGSVATNIDQLLVGHVVQGEFFSSTNEAVWIEADLPPGL